MTLDGVLKAAAGKARGLVLRPELLLCPNVPKPLHGVAPRVILGKAWWDKERRAAYASTGNHCAACGIYKKDAEWHRWLEGHELYEIDHRKGRATYKETVPLCHACHCFIHDGRLTALWERGEVSLRKYVGILSHGLKVLDAAGLTKDKQPSGVKMPAWDKWRMIVNGKAHPPKFLTPEDWLAHHGGSDE